MDFAVVGVGQPIITQMLHQAKKTRGVNAVNRALALLDLFLEGGPSHSLAELTRRAGLVKPTVLRLLTSLEQAGYVTRIANGEYQLGVKVLQLGTVYRKNFGLDAHVLPVLRELADLTGETTSFHIKQGQYRLCLFRVESPHPVRVYMDSGTIHPLDTASGLVLQTYHEHGVQTQADKLVFRTTGIRDTQTASLSAPVFGDQGQLVGALTVTGPIGRFDETVSKRVSPLLAKTAEQLSRKLGATAFPHAKRQSPDATG